MWCLFRFLPIMIGDLVDEGLGIKLGLFQETLEYCPNLHGSINQEGRRGLS